MKIDCIHFYVVDATRTQDLLIKQMGLRSLGGKVNEHTIEYLIGNDRLLFSIASPLNSTSPVADYLQLHPSGVQNISFRVPDLGEMRKKIDRLGIEILEVSADRDKLSWLKIRGWGAIEHTIIQSSPESIDSNRFALDDPIIGIDHLVLNVAVGELESAARWYQNLFDFQVQQTFDIYTQKSGLTSQALISACGKIRFNINQPSSSNSQIQEFLNTNRGAGIQHIGLETNDIFSTIEQMQQQQLAFLPIDRTYYTQIQLRASMEQKQSLSDDEWQKLERLQILIDWNKSAPEALLMQIFTQPIFESPTFFFEIIERRNQAEGFGQGNFQALFEAIEQYQSI
jgi:4-hydroxyphenylpyruvate dioxygenase